MSSGSQTRPPGYWRIQWGAQPELAVPLTVRSPTRFLRLLLLLAARFLGGRHRLKIRNGWRRVALLIFWRGGLVWGALMKRGSCERRALSRRLRLWGRRVSDMGRRKSCRRICGLGFGSMGRG